MRRPLLLLLLLLLLAAAAPRAVRAQVTISPAFATADDTLMITYDRTQGTGGLASVNDISIHFAPITAGPTSTAWLPTIMTWGDPSTRWKLTRVGTGNLFRYRLLDQTTGQPVTVRQFFNIPAGTPIFRIGMVFRGTGPCGGFGGVSTNCPEGKATDGNDIFVNLSQGGGLQVALSQPTAESVLLAEGATLSLSANSSQDADLRIYDGANQVAQVNGSTINYNFAGAAGASGFLRVTATVGANTVADTVYYAYRGAEPAPQNPPGTIRDGINYVNSTTVILQLRLTAEKQYVYALGDFNNWRYDNNYRLRRRADDNNRFWVQISGLTAAQMYRFQYEVDGAIRVADPYSELVLNPQSFENLISEETYPNRPLYPVGKATTPVGVFQTNQPAFAWTDAAWQTPTDPRPLNIYELWVGDFGPKRNFQGVIDSLDYLQKLGVNVIELMPIAEFDGNDSWGYNPTFFAAVDKAYGTREKLKELVNKAHQRGIAVVLDVVFNQTHETNPIAQLWWDPVAFKPATNSPYLNRDATHPFNVFFDFNHESTYTKDYVKQVCKWWLEEYHIDGFRFDLSKGFTQRQTTDVGAWNQYDQGRVDIWADYSSALRSYKSNAMLILEHLGNDDEEKVLADNDGPNPEQRGFWMWGVMHFQYKQSAIGFDNNDIGRTWHANRGFNQHHLIGYMESHDEERINWDVRNFGATSTETNAFYNSAYNMRTNTAIAIDRHKAAAALLFSIPGPKMLWMWGELGYDRSINTCEGGGSVSNDCRLSRKPLPWGWIQQSASNATYAYDTNRVKLKDFYAALLNLRKTQVVFTEGSIEGSQLNGLQKRLRLTHASMNVVVLANFATDTASIDPNFPATGTWYDYFRRDQLTVTNTNASITLAPGEIRFLTSQLLPAPKPRLVPYNESAVPSARITSVSNQCAGASVNVSYTVTLPFATGNTFTLQLSNGSGSFASPTVVGSVTATGAGTIAATLPNTTGTGFRLRIVSSNPASTGPQSAAFALANQPSAPTIARVGTGERCNGQLDTVQVQSAPMGATYQWFYQAAGATQPAQLAGQTASQLGVSLPGTYTARRFDAGLGVACQLSNASNTVVISRSTANSPTVSRNGSDLQAVAVPGILQWYYVGTLAGATQVSGPIFQATATTYRPIVSGRYRIGVKTTAGCVLFSDYLTISDLPTSANVDVLADGALVITPNDGLTDLVLQPNPVTSGEVWLRYPGEDRASNDQIVLMDLGGRVLKSIPHTSQPTGEAQVRLSLGGIPAGAYIVKVRTADHIYLQRLIVQ